MSPPKESAVIDVRGDGSVTINGTELPQGVTSIQIDTELVEGVVVRFPAVIRKERA